MKKHDIGIVIVNYNVRHFLIQCLQSIRHSKLGDLNLEVIIVDNDSVDGSVAWIKNEYPEFKLIENNINVGFSKANNQAIKCLNSTYTLLLNPDTVLEEDCLRLCYNRMEDFKAYGALGVKMIDGKGVFLPESKRKIPDLWSSFCKLSYLSDLFPKSKIFSGYNLGYLPDNEVSDIEVLCGAFMFIRSSVLEETGLLDEAFFMYGEDIDLSYRIIKAGYRICYFPETKIIHYKGESTKKGSLNYIKTFYGAMNIYVNKHYAEGNANLFTSLIRFAIFFRAILSGFGTIAKVTIRPLIDGLVLFGVMYLTQFWWAKYYFHDINYYQSTNIKGILGIYVGFWVFFLWLFGHYDKDRDTSKTIIGVLGGTSMILIIYALLPEDLRSSRALIFIGSAFAFLLPIISDLVFSKWNLFNHDKKKSSGLNIAIVADVEASKKLADKLYVNNIKIENIYLVAPSNALQNAFFTNSIENLSQVVRVLKIDEVIYSNESLSMKEIMHSMMNIDKNVSFKIGGDDSLSIIGSNSKNSQGDFYSLDMNYNLTDQTSLRFKRIFDILFSLLSIVLLPVLVVFTGFKYYIINNICSVLLGKKTWIGYGGEKSDFVFLPIIPQGVIKFPLLDRVLHYQDDHFKKKNIIYAKEYSFFLDLRIYFTHVSKLANE